MKRLLFFSAAVCSLVFYGLCGFPISAETAASGKDNGQQAYQEDGWKEASQKASDILGRGGMVHPYFSFATNYTDNFYNTSEHKEDEVSFLISPGIWFALPGSRKQLIDYRTNPASIGGLQYDRNIPKNFKRLQTYLNYRADIEQNYHKSSENTTDQLGEGFVRLNLRGGLSFELMDQFVKNHNTRSSSSIGKLDKFISNLVAVNPIYHFNDKFWVQLGYKNYYLNYTADRNRSLDRMDNSGSIYCFRQVMPKTAAFIQYEYTYVDYYKDYSPDSSQQEFYAGLDWKISSKSEGRLKLGYGHSNFHESGYSSPNMFLAELETSYRISSKTNIALRGFNGFNSSLTSGLSTVKASEVGMDLNHFLTRRIVVHIKGLYHRDDFQGKVFYYGEKRDRNDNYYHAVAEIKYSMIKWLQLALGYSYWNRNSNFSEYDYSNNTGFLSLLFYR